MQRLLFPGLIYLKPCTFKLLVILIDLINTYIKPVDFIDKILSTVSTVYDPTLLILISRIIRIILL